MPNSKKGLPTPAWMQIVLLILHIDLEEAQAGCLGQLGTVSLCSSCCSTWASEYSTAAGTPAGLGIYFQTVRLAHACMHASPEGLPARLESSWEPKKAPRVPFTWMAFTAATCSRCGSRPSPAPSMQADQHCLWSLHAGTALSYAATDVSAAKQYQANSLAESWRCFHLPRDTLVAKLLKGHIVCNLRQDLCRAS